MEIVIALFLGGWLTLAGVLGYKQIKKDFEPYMKQENKEEKC